jgi:hypothetical protein
MGYAEAYCRSTKWQLTLDQKAMIHRNRYVRLVLAGCGLVLLGAGIAIAYWWFYKMAPLRHLVDPDWLAEHSETARWAEEQKDYQWLGTAPDIFWRGDRIGFYGDKEWFLWLEEQIQNPKFGHCGCTEYALALMANQHTTTWAQWTEVNGGRSQEEWIKDGFLPFGVKAHLPPQADDNVPLLRLLGRKTWDFLQGGPQGNEMPDAVPSYVQYNAYRWLRDSGFKPLEFTSSNPKLAAESEISQGLKTFSILLAVYPGRDGLGVLAFGPQGARGRSWRPLITEPWLVIGVNAFIAISTIGGGMLFWWFIKRAKGAGAADNTVSGDAQAGADSTGA